MLGMERRRDLRYFRDHEHYQYTDFHDILAQRPQTGLHSLNVNDRWFDFFYEDRGQPVTLITFTAAAKDSVDRYPLFALRHAADTFRANVLSFSDAAIGGPEALPTYWHLSTRRVNAQRFIPSIIWHLTLGQERVFFGSSAGGFAALNYSAQFEGSVAFVMNPRINLLNRPRRHPVYTPRVYPGEDPGTIMRGMPYNQAKVYSQPQGNHVVYLQNVQDDRYMKNHYTPFERAVRGRPDVEFILGEWGEGHTVPPKDVYMNALDHLIERAHLGAIPVSAKSSVTTVA